MLETTGRSQGIIDHCLINWFYQIDCKLLLQWILKIARSSFDDSMEFYLPVHASNNNNKPVSTYCFKWRKIFRGYANQVKVFLSGSMNQKSSVDSSCPKRWAVWKNVVNKKSSSCCRYIEVISSAGDQSEISRRGKFH